MNREFCTALLVALVALVACGGSSKKDEDAGDGGGSPSGGGTSGAGTSGAGGNPETGGTGVGAAGSGGDAGAEEGARLEIYGLNRGEPGFVATGALTTPPSSEPRGVIYHSEDGVAWTLVEDDLVPIPWDVEWGNDRFVTLASFFDAFGTPLAEAFVSTDGEDWTPTEVPVTDTGFWTAFGNDVFIGSSSMGGLSTADGETWELEPEGPIGGVEFAADTFVGWQNGDRAVLVGSGANDWEIAELDLGSFWLTAVRAVNDGFRGTAMYDCCFGEVPGEARWKRLSSEDGRVWEVGEELESEPPLVYVDDGSVCIALKWNGVLSGPTCDELEVTYEDGTFLPWGAKSIDGVYFVTGSFGGILSSPDGVSWTRVLWQN